MPVTGERKSKTSSCARIDCFVVGKTETLCLQF